MNTPQIFSAVQINNWPVTSVSLKKGAVPKPARPLGFQGLFLRQRLRCAWLVFTGKADALKW